AAQYVASRLRGYGIQPVMHSDYRMKFSMPINRVESAQLASVGRDSTEMALGYDFWPDGRSDSGRVAVNFVHVAPSGTMQPLQEARSRAVMISASMAQRNTLEDLAARRFDLILIVGELRPVAASQPVAGSLIIWITPAVAAWMVGLSDERFEALWADGEPVLRALPRRLHAAVTTRRIPSAAAANVAGFVAGRDPQLSRDLVMVAASLDAPGTVAGERAIDYRSYGTGLSAMLEVARNEVAIASRWTHPMRSLLFVALSGSRTDVAGLRQLFANPPWEVERIRALIYIGLRPEDEPAVRAVVEALDIRLEVIPVPAEPLFERRYVFTGERSARARSPVRTPGVPYRSPDTAAILSRAVDVSLEMAEETGRLVHRYAGAVSIPSLPYAQEQP
ncbi:MAG: hypothetical protein ACOCTG_00765, partial [Bacteroidota bacterium]